MLPICSSEGFERFVGGGGGPGGSQRRVAALLPAEDPCQLWRSPPVAEPARGLVPGPGNADFDGGTAPPLPLGLRGAGCQGPSRRGPLLQPRALGEGHRRPRDLPQPRHGHLRRVLSFPLFSCLGPTQQSWSIENRCAGQMPISYTATLPILRHGGGFRVSPICIPTQLHSRNAMNEKCSQPAPHPLMGYSGTCSR